MVVASNLHLNLSQGAKDIAKPCQKIVYQRNAIIQELKRKYHSMPIYFKGA
jgi:hypothetical protein